MSEEPTTDGSVLTERRGRILIITINRPEAKNAVNAAVSQGLADATDALDDDPGLSVGIVTGAGGSFCAGMDLKAFARGENVAVKGRGLGFTERPPVKPLIAAVEGYALAGGTELALATDLIVAAADHGFDSPQADYAVTVAKVTLGRVVPAVVTSAHQLHAAIGVTIEHRLWLATQRARSWIGEFGDTAHHAHRLGRLALDAADPWDVIIGSTAG